MIRFLKVLAYILFWTTCIFYTLASVFSASNEKTPATPINDFPALALVSCSADKPVAQPDELVHVRAWATSPTGEPLDPNTEYIWIVDAGRIADQVAQTQWDLNGVEPGLYTATVRVTEPGKAGTHCSIEVIIEAIPRILRGAIPPVRNGRPTGWSFLEPDETEESGYGLYSYLLFASPPTDAARERYLSAIKAFLEFVQPVRKLEKYFSRHQLNITYLPIDTSLPPDNVSPEWVLKHYDYARARFLLKDIKGNFQEGPYIIASLTPLSTTDGISYQYLQDLSRIPPHLSLPWIREFLTQAAQERFWEPKTIAQLWLKLRTTIAILAIGLPQIQKSLEKWIKPIQVVSENISE